MTTLARRSAGGLEIYSSADVADLFAVPERKILDWVREQDWPHVRIGRTVRFTREHLDAIVAKHARLPKADPASVADRGQTPTSAARGRSTRSAGAGRGRGSKGRAA